MELNKNFIEKQKYYITVFEEYSKKIFSEKFNTEKTLLDAMKYSFFAGGKRVRPTLMLSCAEMLNIEFDLVLPFAFALECIHTYSLIHDDLPAMDNDDYRRGKLTNHKIYGEGMAILAGDALLNFAFSVMASENCKRMDIKVCKCLSLISDFAGFEGMIGGQAYDIVAEKLHLKDDEILEYIEKNKTAKLIMCAVLVPALLSENKFNLFYEFGYKLGLQFQIVDDILDVISNKETLGKSIGKDANSGKLTYVSMYGIENAIKKSELLHLECLDILKRIENSSFLIEYCYKLRDRIS